MQSAEVLIERSGHLGRLMLNRPAAMNALTRAMVQAVAGALDAWEHDPSVATVLISGAGERGLCAGGDIVSIYHDTRSGGSASENFWRDEYRLNARIARYPKPLVTFMDGVVLGGGVGISAHASHRIVTERSRIGMPETGIGFVPDVGGSFLLAHAPGELGTHAALTGALLSGADAVAVGLADSFVQAAQLPALAQELATRPAAAAIARHGRVAPPSALLEQRSWIDAAYAPDDIGTILRRLQSAGVPEATAAAATLAERSPTALAVTLAGLRRARALETLERALDQEFRVSVRALRWPDFAEGIRAQLIDKDRTPHWDPATAAELPADLLATTFAGLGERELGLSAVY